MTYSLGLCLIALALFLEPAALARELVVAQQHPSASDENPGTREKPYRTISAATARVGPGDKITIHRGEYRETVILTTSGAAGAPVVIAAAAGETPVIKGSDRLTGWTQDEGSVWKTKIRIPPPRGADGKVAAFWDTNDVRQVFTQDGVLFDAQRLQRVTTRAAMKTGTFFSDKAASVLYVWLPDGASPNDHPPEASLRAAWLNVYADHVIIRGLQMRHASTTALANWPACNLQGNDITLENCTLTWGDFVGMSMNGSHNSIRDCLFACHGDSGIGGTGRDNLIEGCRLVYNNIDRYSSSWHAGGAKLIPNFQHGIIRHNEFAHNQGPGLWLDAGCDENVIDGNLTHDNSGAGIMVEVSRGNLVSNNISYANRNNLSGPYRDADGKIQELALSESRIGPSRLLKLYHAGDGRGIDISSSPETRVLYNTCYLNEGEGICVEGPPRDQMETRAETVANNISVFNKGAQLTLRQTDSATPLATSDHNLLFAVGAVFAKYGWEGPVAMSMPEWQKISGQDAHSLDSDPRFALAVMDDFRLLPNSPAIAAGQPAPEVERDFFAHPRPTAKTTLGACQNLAESYPQPVWLFLSNLIRSAHP